MKVSRILFGMVLCVGSTGALADTCFQYSLRAVLIDSVARAIDCPVPPLHDQPTHERECKEIGIVPARVVETRRLTALGNCMYAESRVQDCDGYADQAALAANAQIAMGCGFTGDRWNLDRQAHYNFCQSQGGDLSFAQAETSARVASFRECLRRFQPPR